MTERKPSELTFRNWVDQQISEARDRGAFDNLPGAGKPLPRRDDKDDGMSWLRDYVRREGVPVEELLPVPLRLRRERELLILAAPGLASEQEVRAAAAELNERIRAWRRIPIGPDIFVPLANADALARSWHEAQPPDPAPEPEPAAPAAGRRRWYHRLRRGGENPGAAG